MTTFNAEKEVAQLKAKTKVIRQKRYRDGHSRLDRYAAELRALRVAGASIAELQRWLKEKRIKVAFSTVSRWLKKHG